MITTNHFFHHNRIIAKSQYEKTRRSAISDTEMGREKGGGKFILLNSIAFYRLVSLARVRQNRIFDYDFDSVLKNRQFGLTAPFYFLILRSTMEQDE